MRACFETKPPTCLEGGWFCFEMFFSYFFFTFSFEGKDLYLKNFAKHNVAFYKFKKSQNSKYQQKYANWKTIYCHIPYETFYYQELQVNKKTLFDYKVGELVCDNRGIHSNDRSHYLNVLH